MARPAQLVLPMPSTWGGTRHGAGRPIVEGRRRPTPHRSRPIHKAAHPVHVTMRTRSGIVSLRSPRAFAAVRAALAAASRDEFRVVHFSVQSDHLHLIVEAHDTDVLSRGLIGLAIRVARAVNRALGRSGPLWGDRYHARALASPREVRNGIRYVLFNFRKHRPADRRRLDPCSSAAWFDGFRQTVPRALDPPTRSPRTWLLRIGWWKRHGLLGLDEFPTSPPL
jgi:REP element-mobilizing transposase RayT